MADRIKNYQQEADQITTLKAIRTDLGVTPSSYTPDATVVTKDRVVTFAQAEEELVVLSDIEKGVKQQIVDVDIAQKDISNIKALLKGNLYDYQTDSSSAYTKSVPAGAMPYAGLEKVGGKTVVMNQLCTNDAESSTVQNVTFTNNGDGSWTLNGTATGNGYKLFTAGTTVSGHKLLFKGCPAGGSDTTYFFGFNGYRIDNGEGGIRQANTSALNIRFDVKENASFNNVKIYPIVVDLTLMFGSGNEPSTVEEFQQMFPAEWYAFNEGTLLSAGVTEVESVGKNLADYSGGLGSPSDASYSNATKRKYTIGKYVFGLAYNNYFSVSRVSNLTVTENSVSFQCSAVGYGFGVPFNCKGNTDYTLSAVLPSNGSMIVLWYNSDGEFLGVVTGASSSPKTYTSPANAKQGVMLFYGATDTILTYSNIQVEENDSATSYSPAGVIATYPIPTAIRNLEGYGWSAGTAYNYIDYERKVFVQNVGKLDLGTANWRFSNVGFFYVSYPYFSPLPKKGIRGEYANIIMPRYEQIVSQRELPVVDKAYYLSDDGGFVLRDDSFSLNATDLKNSLVGVDLYYELGTPIETDISQYLTDDNLIQVESGGTLTFPNSNGTDYQIPVPSEETYMIDLQSAIGG